MQKLCINSPRAGRPDAARLAARGTDRAPRRGLAGSIRWGVGTITALTLAVAGGCDGDHEGRKIDRASAELAGLQANAAGVITSASNFDRPRNTLREVDTWTVEGEQEAAALIEGEAELLRGLVQAREARRLLAEIGGLTLEAEGLIQDARAARQGAEAARFEPAGPIARLEAIISDRERERTNLRRQLDDLQSQIADLAQRRDVLQGREAETRRRQSDLQRRADAADGQGKLELVRQTVRAQRQADEARLSADLLQIEIDGLEPTAARAQQRLTLAEQQIRDAESSINRLREDSRSAQQFSSAAEQRAGAIERRLTGLVLTGDASGDTEAGRRGLKPQLDGPAMQAVTTALDTLDEAANRANAARPATRDGADNLEARADHAAGALLKEAAIVHLRLADVLAEARDLPSVRRGQMDQARTALVDAAKVAMGDAAQRFTNAADALGSLNAQGWPGAQLEAAAATLRQLADYAREAAETGELGTPPPAVRPNFSGGGTAQASAAQSTTQPAGRGARQPRGGSANVTPTPRPAASGDPGGAGTPEDEVREALRRMVDDFSAGRFANLPTYINTTTPEQDQIVSLLVNIAESGARLDQAMKAQFGQGVVAVLQTIPGAGDATSQLDSLTGEVDTLLITVEGDSATVRSPDEAEPTTMSRINGRWLLDFPAGQIPPEAAGQLQQASLLPGLIDDFTDRVRSGEFGNFAEAQGALLQAIFAAFAPDAGGTPGVRPPPNRGGTPGVREPPLRR